MSVDPERGVDSLSREELLAAWRDARREISRAEAGLAARSRELDLLQTLGRRAAEAGRPDELFEATAEVLHEGLALDLILAGWSDECAPRLVVWPARPVAERCLVELGAKAAQLLGWSAGTPGAERRDWAGFDAARGEREQVREDELLLLPVVRQGRPVACLVVVAAAADEARLRALYGASNQLSLHLDRILTLREAEADRFRAIVDSMPQGVLLADARLRPLQANRSAREMLAAARIPAVDDLGPLVERLGLAAAVERVAAGSEELVEGEAHVDEDRVWSVTVSPVLDPRRGVEGLVLVLDDVSERRRLRDQLDQAEKMSSLGRLLAGVAHELNNPLASVVGYAQLLGAGAADEKLAERLRILRREADRCRRIVENLLTFARRREPEIRPLSLNDVMQSVVGLLEYSLRVEAVRIEVAADRDLPPVRGDQHQLDQVLVNLVTNARHAIRKAGRPGVIRLRTSHQGEHALLEVSDDGPGVPESIRARIFDPFFTTKAAGEGTGLGLSLVYEIVTAHGGTIEVEPAPEGGTTFRILLPVHRASAGERPAAPSPAVAACRRGKILVVDDEDPVARLICEALDEDGHRTERAADGRQALERLDRDEFDLIISDLRMPGMDGEQLGRELEARAPELRRRMVWTTGDTLGRTPQALVERAGGEVLRKPFDLDELRRIVRERLGPPDG